MESEAIGDHWTYTEPVESSQLNDWKRVIKAESTSMMLNNVFSASNAPEGWLLQLRTIVCEWVCNTEHDPDSSTQYKSWLLSNRYQQTGFDVTYATAGMITMFRYLISLIGRSGCSLDHLNVVTAFLKPKLNDDDLNMTLPKGRPKWLNAPKMMVMVSNALYSLKQAAQLEYDDINAFLVCLGLY